MTPSGLLPIANHLWQSTLFAGAAGLLTLLLRRNRAHARYCLWLAASVKFLVPFSLLVFAGSQLGRHATAAPARFSVPLMIEQVNEPFVAESAVRPTPHPLQTARPLLPILLAAWAVGFGILALSWWLRWHKIRRVLRAASPLPLGIGIPVLSSGSFMEPGVFGVFRPVLLLPDGIADRLSPAELQAVLAHELCHVRRRDNLATAIHMIVEAVFWFYPLVWWLGARLMEERECACDEEVLRSGSQPEAYAEGILKICELYMACPSKCVAGVTGSNLKKRIEAIMHSGPTSKLNFAKKASLAIAGFLAVAIPVILGVTNAPLLRAQADPNQRFEVASVRRVEIPNNGRGVPVFPPTGGIGTSDPTHIAWHGLWLMNLISEAFGVKPENIIGLGPVAMERYDFIANIPEGATKEQYAVMLGNLLRDRFHLRFHMDSKVMPAYALRVGKNGPKFKDTVGHDDPTSIPRSTGPDADGFPIVTSNFKGIVGQPNSGEIFWRGQNVPMAQLAGLLESPQVGRPIVDETGLMGHYDFKIRLPGMRRPGADTGVPSDPAPSVFTAVEEQLGLKLESSSKPFPQLIIDNIDRDPTEN